MLNLCVSRRPELQKVLALYFFSELPKMIIKETTEGKHRAVNANNENFFFSCTARKCGMKLCFLNPLIEGNTLKEVGEGWSSPWCHTYESECEKPCRYWPIVSLANMFNNSGGSVKGQLFVKRIGLLLLYSEWHLRVALLMVSEGWALTPWSLVSR